MSVDILVPSLGDGIESADVLEVLVSVGDMIKKEDGIVELETDKATAVVPATAAGKVIKIHVAEGDSVPVGKVILTLEPAEAESRSEPEDEPSSSSSDESKTDEADEAESDEAESDTDKPKKPEKPAATSGAKSKPASSEPDVPDDNQNKKTSSKSERQPNDTNRSRSNKKSESDKVSRRETETDVAIETDPVEIAAGPAMRRLAREVGVDLSHVSGSGSSGRITREDIMSVVRAGGTDRKAAQGGGQRDAHGPVRIEKLSRMRRAIAKQMHQSWSTVPRVTNFDDADVTDLEAIRQTSKADYAARGIKLTSMPFVIKSVAMALRDHPIINSSLAEDQEHIIFKNYVSIGIAVDTERGLVVPAMRNADRLSIPDIAKQLASMAEKVRNNEFSLDDLKGGTFTISNLGAIGGTYSTPIINVPENSIILIGKSRKLPVVRGDQIVPRLIMPLSISYDHRLVDGAAAARFLNDVIGYLEAPSRLLLAP